MMTPDQRYFFDLTGYLHLEGVLQGEELQKTQEAAQRYIDTPPDQVPDGFEINLEREHFNWYLHAFAFDKALEALTMHPLGWIGIPVVSRVSDGPCGPADELPALVGIDRGPYRLTYESAPPPLTGDAVDLGNQRVI